MALCIDSTGRPRGEHIATETSARGKVSKWPISIWLSIGAMGGLAERQSCVVGAYDRFEAVFEGSHSSERPLTGPWLAVPTACIAEQLLKESLGDATERARNRVLSTLLRYGWPKGSCRKNRSFREFSLPGSVMATGRTLSRCSG